MAEVSRRPGQLISVAVKDCPARRRGTSRAAVRTLVSVSLGRLALHGFQALPSFRTRLELTSPGAGAGMMGGEAVGLAFAESRIKLMSHGPVVFSAFS